MATIQAATEAFCEKITNLHEISMLCSTYFRPASLGIVDLTGSVLNPAQLFLNRQVRSDYAAKFSPATSRQSLKRWRSCSR